MQETVPSKYARVKVIIAVALLSVGAGYVGGLSGQSYMDYLREIVQSEQLIQRATSSRTFSLSDLIANTSPSIVAIYRLDDKDIADKVHPLPTKESYVKDAIAVTSDGWIVAPTLDDSIKLEKKEIVDPVRYVGVYKQAVYPISKSITDPASGVSFLKIEGARLKSASFAWEQSTVGSISAHTVSSIGEVGGLYLSQPHYSTADSVDGYLTYTNILSKRFNPDMSFPQIGVAVVSDNGDILGITQKEGVIPSYRFRSSLDQVLTSNKIQRISSNAIYYDNAWMPHLEFTNIEFPASGAYIVDPVNTASSDQSVGLKKGDIVLHVNNENVDINRSLSDVLNQYKPGDVVKVGLQREGTSIDISLTLK